MEQKTADLLIEQYRRATSRTRSVFLILQLISVSFVIAYYNYRYTWLKRVIEVFKAEKGEWTDTEDKCMSEGLDYFSKVYANAKELNGDMKFIDFDLVGLEIYIEDLPLIGSIALTIVLTWFFYVNRRESGIVREIYTRMQGLQDNKMIEHLFYGTAFNLVFNTIRTVDEEGISLSQLLAKKVRKVLIYLPVLILTVIMVHDGIETFRLPTPYKGGVTVWQYFEGNLGGRIEIITRMVLTIPLLIYCFAQCRAIAKFATRDSGLWEKMESQFLRSQNRI